MSKCVLVFVFIFALVQLSLAGVRLPRDTENSANDLGKALTGAFDAFVNKLEETFTKENLDKVSDELKDFGSKLQQTGQEFLAKFEKKPETSS